jgi:hypothetical protein
MGTAAPDVRIRLSAEGVQEVVAAFRQIQAEAARTAQASRTAGEGHAFLNKQLASLKSLLPMLGVAALVAGFISAAKSGIELADDLGKLQQKTALTGDTLSTLAFAARFADVEQEALGKGLVRFTKSMDDYDKRATTARGAIKALFGDPNALQGLNMDQRLQKIVQRMAELGPGTVRTGAAIALFGKAGADLLPVMDELGAQGFDRLRERAKKLGLDLSDDAVQGAENLKRSLITLKAEAQGMATQFLLGLAPQLANAANTITDATAEGGVSGFQKIGTAAGYVISGIVAAFMIVGKTIGYVLHEGELAWDHFGEYAKDAIKGIWPSLKESAGHVLLHNPMAFFTPSDLDQYKPGNSQFTERFKAFIDDQMKSVAALFATPPTTKKPKTPDAEGNTPDTGKAAKAALDLAQAQADARLKVESALQKQQEAAEREKYDKGLESLAQYYAARLAIVQQQGHAEVDAAQAKVDALTKAPLAKDEQPDERQAKIVAAQADVDVKRIDVQTQINALKGEEAKETEALQQKVLDFEKTIAQAEGDRSKAAKAAVDAQAAKYAVTLRQIAEDKGAENDPAAAAERARFVAAYRAAAYQQVDFDELQRQATQAMNALDTAREAIAQQVESGTLFDFQGEQQRMALEQQRLPLLRQIADQMVRAAITPEQIQAAADFAARVDALAVSSNKAALEMAKFKANVEQALTSELSTWLSSGIEGAGSLGAAFAGLALSIVQSLRQIAAQMLATYLIQKLLGLIGLGAFPTSAVMSGVPAASVTAAGGGLIRGPGTGTSDSIPARLSNGEYVVRAAVVRRPGVREDLDKLNFGTPVVRRMHAARYADGGLVDVPPAAGPSHAALTATLGLDEGLLLKRLEATPEFHRVYVRMAQKNQKAMRQAIGS